MNAALANPIAPAAPDTLRLAKRFFWKELRMQSGLAMGAGAIAVLVMLVLWANVPVRSHPNAMQVVAFATAALFAVAAAVTLFAMDHEEGTTSMLETLPRNRQAMLLGKLLAGLTATLALLAVMNLAGFVAAGLRWPPGPDAAVIATLGGVAIAEAFAWGLMASLLIANPLLAAVVGIVLASMNSQVAMLLTVPDAMGFTGKDFYNAVPGRLVLCLLAAVIDGWLGMRWLAPAELRAPTTRAQSLDPAWRPGPVRRWLGVYWRLAWQTYRESWKTAAGVAGIAFAFVAVASVAGPGSEPWYNFAALSYPALYVVAALFGGMVFRADQRQGQYRFLSEHAGRPRVVWFARHAVWMSYLGCLAVLVAVVFGWFVGAMWAGSGGSLAPAYQLLAGDLSDLDAVATQLTIEEGSWTAARVTIAAAIVPLVAYAAGQCCSLLLKSSIFSGLLSLGAAALLAAWTALVVWCRLPVTWFVLPLAVGALLATLLRVRSWMFQQNELKHWVAPLLALLAPVLAVGWCFEPARQRQLSPPYLAANLANPNRSTDPLAPPVNKAVAERDRGLSAFADYSKLASSLYAPTKETDFVSGDQAEILAADDRQLSELERISKIDCRLPASYQSPFSPDGGFWSVIQGVLKRDEVDLASLLACRRAIVQQERGNYSLPIDEPGQGARAVENAIVDWAVAQTDAEVVLEAARELRQVDEPLASPVEQYVNRYLNARTALREQSSPQLSSGAKARQKEEERDLIYYLLCNLPGEPARAERALELLATSDLDFLQGWANGLRPDASPSQRSVPTNHLQHRTDVRAMPLTMASAFNGVNVSNVRHNLELVSHADTSLAARAVYPPRPHELYRWLDTWLAGYSRRQAEVVRLALIAYRIDHGEYPESLAEIAPKYLTRDRLIDPRTRIEFAYSPTGFDSLAWDQNTQRRIDPYTPAIWMLGSYSEPIPSPPDLAEEWEGGQESEDRWTKVIPAGTSWILPLPVNASHSAKDD